MSAKAAVLVILLCVLLIACQAPEPSPSQTIAPTASPTPSVAPTSVSTPTPTPNPTPTGTPVSIDVVLARFLSVTRGVSSAHMYLNMFRSASYSGTHSRTRIEFEGDMSGTDFRGSMLVRADDGTTKQFELVVVDGVSYTRSPGGEWSVGDGENGSSIPINVLLSLPTDPSAYTSDINPYAADTTDGCNHVVLDDICQEGQVLYQIEVTGPTAGGLPMKLRNQQTNALGSPIEFGVGGDGVPVVATWSFSVSGKMGSKKWRGGYLLWFEFSDFGEPVEIAPPI